MLGSYSVTKIKIAKKLDTDLQGCDLDTKHKKIMEKNTTKRYNKMLNRIIMKLS